jgi:hypothetical protein
VNVESPGKGMKIWDFELSIFDDRIVFHVAAPNTVDPLDEYRGVTFALPGKRIRRAAFWLLPGKPPDRWGVPVFGDDNTMFFIPSLPNDHNADAIANVVGNGLDDEAFENEDDIVFNDG